MTTSAAPATAPAVAGGHAPRLRVPPSVEQVLKLARYQLREYVRSSRFLIMVALVLAIDAILTTVVAYYRPGFLASALEFYPAVWAGGVVAVIVLSAVFFGGDAIAGEFQNKTGYFLMGLPVRRATVYAGKFIAATLASAAVLALFLANAVGNGLYYFGSAAFPWQLGVSVGLAIVYLLAVLGTTFLFSSLFKTSVYGFVMTALLFLAGFTVLQTLVADLIRIEPWMLISYANGLGGGVVSEVFIPGAPWGLSAMVVPNLDRFGRVVGTSYIPGIAEGAVIMAGYFLGTTLGGLLLFEREEFT